MQLQLGSRLQSDFFIAFDEYVGRWKGFMAPLSKPLATVLLSNNFVWQTAIEMSRYISMDNRVIKPLN